MTDRLDLPTRYRKQVKSLLREFVPEAEVWAYGSRVNGMNHDASDLDLVLRGPDLAAIPIGQMLDLEEAFERSNIPILVEARDWTRLPESFHGEIERDYVVLVEGQTISDTGIPYRWRAKSLGECAKLIRDPISPSSANDVPYIGLEHIGQHNLSLLGHGKSSDVKSAKTQFFRNDILFGKLRPYFRKIIQAPFNGICSTDIWVVRATEDVDQRFLYYLMANWPFVDFATAGSEGTRMPRAKWEYVTRYPLALPPLTEQRRIAHVLGTLDDKIELNRRMCETLEETARLLFRSWFVNFDPVRAKMEGRWRRGESLPGLPAELYNLFPNRLFLSELGPIPEGWKIDSLDGLIEIVSGGTPKTTIAEYWNGSIPWYTAKDAPLPGSVFVLETERTITSQGVANSATRVLPKGTTVISARGSVGKLACLGNPMAMNQTCYGLRGKQGFPDYFTYLNVKRTLEQLQQQAYGTIFDTITRQTFRNVTMAAPPLESVRRFEAMASPLMNRILDLLYHSKSLAALRDSLLPKLVSGEIRVEETEALVA